MKADVFDSNGNKEKEIEMPECFYEPVREDIVMKAVEARKSRQPYAPFEMAGKQSSASGKIRHGRRKWRTAYGKGISRVPRKIMWRRGDQFYWIASEISGSRKGRRAHPPRVLSMTNARKINKKEFGIALRSALSATANPVFLKKRYESIGEISLKLPLVIDGKALGIKNKEFRKLIDKILGKASYLAVQEKKIRAGKGKLRGRRYRKNAGMLLVIGNKEKAVFQGIETKRAGELGVNDLAEGALGRLTMYTEQAVEDIKNKFGEKK